MCWRDYCQMCNNRQKFSWPTLITWITRQCERFVDGESAGHEKSMRFVPFSIFEKNWSLDRRTKCRRRAIRTRWSRDVSCYPMTHDARPLNVFIPSARKVKKLKWNNPPTSWVDSIKWKSLIGGAGVTWPFAVHWIGSLRANFYLVSRDFFKTQRTTNLNGCLILVKSNLSKVESIKYGGDS